MPHARHAPSIATDGHHSAKRSWPGQLRITAPATIAAIPNAMRRSKFSRNANHASSAVNTPSAFNSSEVPAADIRVSPNISSTGAITPPAVIAAASHSISDLAIRTGVLLVAVPIDLHDPPRPP